MGRSGTVGQSAAHSEDNIIAEAGVGRRGGGLVDGAGVLPGPRRIRRGTRSLGMAAVLLPAGRGRRGRLVAPPGATGPLVLEPAMGSVRTCPAGADHGGMT